MFNFLEFEFTPLKIEHKEKLSRILKKYPENISKYSFTALFTWHLIYFYSFTLLEEETLLISTFNKSLNQLHLLEPIGPFSLESSKELLKKIKKLNYPIKIFAVSDAFIQKNVEFCSHFELLKEDKFTNYLYKSSHLASIEGRKFAKKRNLITQAKMNYDSKLFSLNEIWNSSTKKILDEIVDKTHKEITTGLDHELLALKTLLSHYEELEKEGTLLLLDEKPAAFSIWTELNQKTADICFEKADKSFKGIYQLINQETAKMILKAGYEKINREEDLGVIGLRQAKLSYFPDEFVSSSTLTFKIFK